MSQYTTVETPGGIIWVEVDDQISKKALVPASTGNRALTTFEEALTALKTNAKKVFDAVEELAPNEVEISFGIMAGAEGGNTFFGLAKVSGEASYTVTLKWKYDAESEGQSTQKGKPIESAMIEASVSDE